MDYDIIKSRHSVRTYTLQPLSADEVVMLDSQIRRYNAEGSLNMQLVVNEPNAFGRSLMAHYGKFRNVTNYIALTGPKSNDTEAKLGYYGEKIVLEAQKAGLNTCWVGLSFSKKNTPIDIPDGNKLYALIAIGHGAESGTDHRIKAPQQISDDYATAPDWFKRGVDYALLAPTALNQQKFRFQWLGDNRVKASRGIGFFTKMDLGIACCHFEFGAGIPIDWQ